MSCYMTAHIYGNRKPCNMCGVLFNSYREGSCDTTKSLGTNIQLIVLINKSETPVDRKADIVIHDSIGKVLSNVYRTDSCASEAPQL